MVEPTEERQILGGMIKIATDRLLAAKTVKEILIAKHLAMTAMYFAKISRGGTDLHGECLKLVSRAEFKLNDAVDDLAG